MFYWSYENFKMVENEFEKQIVCCKSFPPISGANLEHGAFCLEDGKNYYVLEGMMGFHIFEVARIVSAEDTLFLSTGQGVVKLFDKKSLAPISMKRIMGLPLESYDDVIPTLIHKEEKKHPKHCIIVGHEPEDDEGMVCVQEYHDGFRTVWMSQETLDSPIEIDEDYYSLDLPEDLESLCDFIDNSKDEIEEMAKEEPRTSFINCEYVDFVYMDRYYRMLPRAFELHPEIFDIIVEGIEKQLIEMGAPYVDIYKQKRW